MTAYLFQNNIEDLPSGKRLHSHGTSPSLIGKKNYKCAMFNSYVKLPEGVGKQSEPETHECK